MLKEHKRPLSQVFWLIELSIILLSFYVAYLIRFSGEDPDTYRPPVQFPVFFFSYLIVWFYLSSRFNLYCSKRLNRFRREAWDVAKTTGLCLLIASLPAFFFREMPLSRLFLLYLWPLQTGGLIVFRLAVREVLKNIRRRGYNSRNVLFVGWNPRAEGIVRAIKNRPDLGLHILGVIDEQNDANGTVLPHFVKRLGDANYLQEILIRNVVDEVFITLPIKSFYTEIEKIIRTCEQVGVEVKLPIDLFNMRLAKSTVSSLGDLNLIELYTGPQMSWRLLVKRSIDIFASIVLLALLSPLFVLASVLIKMTSRGPVFFVQKRLGYNGRPFRCLKFRTMIKDADKLKKSLEHFNERDGPVFKITNDPRVTKVGRLLRKSSIDELPQLLNVLAGSMSLVGPRPPIPEEVDQYDLTTRRRLSIKPGITCLWQINGRCSMPFDKWMQLDMQYIDNWSLYLDLKILLLTVPAVLKGSGAT